MSFREGLVFLQEGIAKIIRTGCREGILLCACVVSVFRGFGLGCSLPLLVLEDRFLLETKVFLTNAIFIFLGLGRVSTENPKFKLFNQS